MEEIKKAIEMLNNFCDVILDMPCGCDCCPYIDTKDEDAGRCDVYDTIAKLKEHIK